MIAVTRANSRGGLRRLLTGLALLVLAVFPVDVAAAPAPPVPAVAGAASTVTQIAPDQPVATQPAPVRAQRPAPVPATDDTLPVTAPRRATGSRAPPAA